MGKLEFISLLLSTCAENFNGPITTALIKEHTASVAFFVFMYYPYVKDGWMIQLLCAMFTFEGTHYSLSKAADIK